MQARASARAPERAKVQFSNAYTNYASKQKNHHERSPKPTIEAGLIQTFSQNDIFCKSDLTICFFFDTKHFHTWSQKTKRKTGAVL